MPMHGAPLFGRGLSLDLTVSRRSDSNVELDDMEALAAARVSDTIRRAASARSARPRKRAWAPDLPERGGERAIRGDGDKPPNPANMDHRARPAPFDHLCTCGHLREVCVRQEVRAFWRLIHEPPAPPRR